MGHGWLLTCAALLSMMSGRGMASSHRSIYSSVTGFNSSDLDQVRELHNVRVIMLSVMDTLSTQKCKMGPTLRCERVNIDVATIKTGELISFEGMDYKRYTSASHFECQIYRVAHLLPESILLT